MPSDGPQMGSPATKPALVNASGDPAPMSDGSVNIHRGDIVTLTLKAAYDGQYNGQPQTFKFYNLSDKANPVDVNLYVDGPNVDSAGHTYYSVEASDGTSPIPTSIPLYMAEDSTQNTTHYFADGLVVEAPVDPGAQVGSGVEGHDTYSLPGLEYKFPGIPLLGIPAENYGFQGIKLDQSVGVYRDASGNYHQVSQASYSLNDNNAFSDTVGGTVGDTSATGISGSHNFGPTSVGGTFDPNDPGGGSATINFTAFSFGKADSPQGAPVVATGADAFGNNWQGAMVYLKGIGRAFTQPLTPIPNAPSSPPKKPGG